MAWRSYTHSPRARMPFPVGSASLLPRPSSSQEGARRRARATESQAPGEGTSAPADHETNAARQPVRPAKRTFTPALTDAHDTPHQAASRHRRVGPVGVTLEVERASPVTQEPMHDERAVGIAEGPDLAEAWLGGRRHQHLAVRADGAPHGRSHDGEPRGGLRDSTPQQEGDRYVGVRCVVGHR